MLCAVGSSKCLSTHLVSNFISLYTYQHGSSANAASFFEVQEGTPMLPVRFSFCSVESPKVEVGPVPLIRRKVRTVICA